MFKFAPLGKVMNRTLDREVKLAVTGLRRSGKTVFITSLVHQLLHGLNSTHLPFFEVVNSGHLRGSKIMPQPNLHIPAFPYHHAIAQLCHEYPNWPQATDGLSEIQLAIRYQSQGLLAKSLSSSSTLYLDIIDYPGEWLLDLPLLNWTYEQWSAHITQLCQTEPRYSLSEEWRNYLSTLAVNEGDIDPLQRDQFIRQGSQLYTAFLHCCKEDKYGLSLLQPGRFTMPGELKDTTLLEFYPTLSLPAAPIKVNSIYAEMKKRYDSYKEQVVQKFYRQHFASFDRQIVLVDVLKALNTSYASYEDMREAINLVLHSFQYGKSGFLNKLFGLKIDGLLFATTKADHVTPNQLPNLERFLQTMLAKSYNNVSFEGVKTTTLALASIKSTQSAYTTFQGQRFSCIKGVPLDGDKPVALFPGEVPYEGLLPEGWIDGRFNFISFKPPRLSDSHSSGLPHIRMDRALEFLLGDKF